MAIEDVIKARYERFNRMYLKAVGHTFEEDPAWCDEQTKKEMPDWEKERDNLLAEFGIKDEKELEELFWRLSDDDQNPMYQRMKELYRKKPSHISLYYYEKSCIDQAKAIYDFLASKGEPKEMYHHYGEGNCGIYEFVERLKNDGFDKWSEDHSGNSGCVSIQFAHCLCDRPELFPYLHGAMSALVGDEGYHDTRDDLPKYED